MSRRKQPQGLFGADGRPVGWKPKPRPILGTDLKPLPRVDTAKGKDDTVFMVTTAGDGKVVGFGDSIWKQAMNSYLGRSLYGASYVRYAGLSLGDVAGLTGPAMQKPRPTGLDDIEALLSGMDLSDFESGVQELPEGTIDPTKYADAFYLAAKACKHTNYEDTMYAKREAKCLDCGRYFKRERGMFGW